jgi:hypothetical protein
MRAHHANFAMILVRFPFLDVLTGTLTGLELIRRAPRVSPLINRCSEIYWVQIYRIY